MDDIDDLLDEVEATIFKDKKASQAKGSTTSKGSVVTKSSNSASNNISKASTGGRGASGLKGYFSDSDEDDEPARPAPVSQTRSDSFSKLQRLPSNVSKEQTKCFPVFIGPPSVPQGMTRSSTMPATCDRLRCTACDFRIVSFQDYTWSSSCDYLFFRNNVPDFNKLKVNLLRRAGTTAYACQCKWRSVDKLKNVADDVDLKWVCGRHSNAK
eukprot:Opistho-2@58043